MNREQRRKAERITGVKLSHGPGVMQASPPMPVFPPINVEMGSVYRGTPIRYGFVEAGAGPEGKVFSMVIETVIGKFAFPLGETEMRTMARIITEAVSGLTIADAGQVPT